MAMVKDPVCGMEIDSESAAASSVYEGATYYFCAVGCKEEFDASPGKYVAAGAAAPTAGGAPRSWWQFWRR